MPGSEIENLIALIAKLPGLGPRSARRAALYLIKHRGTLLDPLAEAMRVASEVVKTCTTCGNLDTIDPCELCMDEERERGVVCVVEEVGDLWALERTRAFHGQYHVLGGALSALSGIRPEDLSIGKLLERVKGDGFHEVILALSATVEGQTTAHYIADLLMPLGISVTRLAHGVPMGGELHYLDDGTLTTAMRLRQKV